MYFVKRDGRYVDASGQSFRDFMAGELDELPGERPHAEGLGRPPDHPLPRGAAEDVSGDARRRLRPVEPLCALPALWAGMLYDSAALAAAWDLCKDWTAEDHERLRVDVARLGLKAEVAGRSVQDVAKDLVAIAREGLKRRARAWPALVDETGYLRELEEIADSGVTPAERLLELYHGPWAGDARRAFDELAY